MNPVVPHNPKPTIFCPVCATERERPILHIPRGILVVISLFWAFTLGLLLYLFSGIWVGLWVGALSGGLCFLALEVYDTVKFKRELICPICHFDPGLYRRSPEEAQARCAEKLKGQKEFMNMLRAAKNQG